MYSYYMCLLKYPFHKIIKEIFIYTILIQYELTLSIYFQVETSVFLLKFFLTVN